MNDTPPVLWPYRCSKCGAQLYSQPQALGQWRNDVTAASECYIVPCLKPQRNHSRINNLKIYFAGDQCQFNQSNLTMNIVETRNPNPSALPSTAVAVPATRWTKSRSRRKRGSFNLTADLPLCDYEGEFKICATHYMTGCGRVASTAPVCKEATSNETVPSGFNEPLLSEKAPVCKEAIPDENMPSVLNQPLLSEKSSIIPAPVEVLQTRPSDSTHRRVGAFPPKTHRSCPSPTADMNREREHALASATAATPHRLQVTTPVSLKAVFADDSASHFFSHCTTWLAATVNLGNRPAVTSRLVKQSAAAAALIVLFAICFPANMLGNLSGSVPLLSDSPHALLILEFVQSVVPPSAPPLASDLNASFASAIVPHHSVEFHSKLFECHPNFCSGRGVSALHSENRHSHRSATHHDTFIPNLVVKLDVCTCAAVAAALLVVYALRSFVAINSRTHVSRGRLSKRAAASIVRAFILCALCIQGAVCANVSVSVDPLNGQDRPECDVAQPCQTIAYAIHARRATNVMLSNGTFSEASVVVNSSVPFLNVHGSRDASVFDCSRRVPPGRGPAFIVSGASIALSGITFQNCINFDALSGTGGAVSANSSTVAVTDCAFFNNVAQTGGAVGVLSSTLTVTRSLFENNTATCRNTSTACSAWGGAVGTVESASVQLSNNDFSRNSVNLELIGVRDGDSRAAGGGGCVSVMYHADVSGSRVYVDGNLFRRCSVRIFGSNNTQNGSSGVQYGNGYGGAVSLYYGLRPAPFRRVHDASSSFVNNRFHSSAVAARVGVGGNAYGGCVSVYAGSWNVDMTGTATVASVFLEGMRTNISSNSLVDCTSTVAANDRSEGMNAYGGGISVALGVYSYSRGGNPFAGNTTVSSSSFTVSSNTLTNCTASSSTSSTSSARNSPATSTSNGANAYGGGISVGLGAYDYSGGRNLFTGMTGDTTVSSSSFTVSSNTLTHCIASSSTSSSSSSSSSASPASSTSNGATAYGGGISIGLGAYTYTEGFVQFAGDTTVSSSNITVSSNTLSNCTASLSTSSASSTGFSPASSTSNRANAYGGAISIALGVYSYSAGVTRFRGDTTVSSSSFTVSSNTLTNCSASSSTSSTGSGDFLPDTSTSNGANVYGGGISIGLGAYSGVGDQDFRGNTTVSSSSFTVSSNTLTNCTASSSTSSTTTGSGFISSSSSPATSTSNGANVYGGGISVALGVYSYSRGNNFFTGNTTVSSSSFTVSSNTLTHCTASSSTSSSSSSSASPVTSTSNGANAYGGGSSIGLGAYSTVIL